MILNNYSLRLRYTSLIVRLFAFMALTILTATTRYVDYGAIYLTEDQMKASFLELRVSIVKMQSPISTSFLRNPPQSVYGYLTTCYQECIYDEIQCRYDYQSLYRHLDNYQLLAQLECIYYRAIAANQNSIASSNAAQGPYTILQVDGLTAAIRRPVDSFRFRGINPCIFDFHLFWSYDDTNYETCGVQILDLPPIVAPSNDAPPYDPNRHSDPNAAVEQITNDPPTDDEATTIPDDAPETDFGPRNEQPFVPPPFARGTWPYVLRLRRRSNGEILVYNQSVLADNYPVPFVQQYEQYKWEIVAYAFGNPFQTFNSGPDFFDLIEFTLGTFVPQ